MPKKTYDYDVDDDDFEKLQTEFDDTPPSPQYSLKINDRTTRKNTYSKNNAPKNFIPITHTRKNSELNINDIELQNQMDNLDLDDTPSPIIIRPDKTPSPKSTKKPSPKPTKKQSIKKTPSPKLTKKQSIRTPSPTKKKSPKKRKTIKERLAGLFKSKRTKEHEKRMNDFKNIYNSKEEVEKRNKEINKLLKNTSVLIDMKKNGHYVPTEDNIRINKVNRLFGLKIPFNF